MRILVGIAAGVAGGGGEATTAVIAGSQSVIQRTFLRYNRGEEAAADQAALDYLARARISPIGLSKLLGRFRGQEVFNLGTRSPGRTCH